MKPLVDVALGTEKIFESELRVTGENGKSRQITSSCSSREYVAKIKLASSSNRLVIQGAGGVKENPRVGAGCKSESRSPSSRVIRTYNESRYGSVSVSATSTCIYERFYLSAPSVTRATLAHPPVSARAPVDNAIEASIEAIDYEQRFNVRTRLVRQAWCGRQADLS